MYGPCGTTEYNNNCNKNVINFKNQTDDKELVVMIFLIF